MAGTLIQSPKWLKRNLLTSRTFSIRTIFIDPSDLKKRLRRKGNPKHHICWFYSTPHYILLKSIKSHSIPIQYPIRHHRLSPCSDLFQSAKKLFCQVLCQSWKPDIHFEAPETKKGENARKRQIFFIVPTLRVSLWISCFLFKDIICHVVDFDSSFVVRVSDPISWIWPLLCTQWAPQKHLEAPVASGWHEGGLGKDPQGCGDRGLQESTGQDPEAGSPRLWCGGCDKARNRWAACLQHHWGDHGQRKPCISPPTLMRSSSWSRSNTFAQTGMCHQPSSPPARAWWCCP